MHDEPHVLSSPRLSLLPAVCLSLSATLDVAPHPVRRQLQEVLQNSLTLRPLVFLNELCPHTALVAPRTRLAAQVHRHRQLVVAMAFFRDQLLYNNNHHNNSNNTDSSIDSSAPLMLLVADEEDSDWQQHQQQAGGAARIITMRQFVASVCGSDRDSGAAGAGAGAGAHPLWELLDTASAARQSHLQPVSPSPSCSSLLGHTPYLSPQELQQGLQQGRLVTGELSVFPYCTQEAEVVFGRPLPLLLALPPPSTAGSNSSSRGEEQTHTGSSSSSSTSVGSCLVSGMGPRNRAMHGDLVAIQVRDDGERGWCCCHQALLPAACQVCSCRAIHDMFCHLMLCHVMSCYDVPSDATSRAVEGQDLVAAATAA